jgi:uncharacterized damage-inducible protein DinB
MYASEYTWFDIITGKSAKDAFAHEDQIREQAETKSIEEMKMIFFDLSERYMEFLNSQEDTEKIIVVDNPHAGLLETSVSELVLHVVTHGSYHRGNIATMLRQMGYSSVTQDYALYLFMPQTP